MKKYACQYKIIQFMPFAETREFANIGIVLYSPSSSRLDFNVAPKQFRRITQFFQDMDKAVYTVTIENLKSELGRLKEFIETDMNPDRGKSLFAEITRSKGSILSFSETRVLFTSDVSAKADDLYNHYVGRNFVTRSYRENDMNKALRLSLKRFSLDRVFKEKVLSDGLTDVRFPFVREINGEALSAIKPLAFEQATTTKIVDHADLWYSKVRRLTNSGTIQASNILITFDDMQTDEKRVWQYIYRFRGELDKLGVQTASFKDEKAVLGFASSRAGD